MARVSKAVVEHNAARLLAFVLLNQSMHARRARVSLSYRQICGSLGFTENRVRCLVRKLQDKGFLDVASQQAPDGGTMANTYRVTASGKRYLFAYRFSEESENQLAASY